jgi:hypothetical protein
MGKWIRAAGLLQDGAVSRRFNPILEGRLPKRVRHIEGLSSSTIAPKLLRTGGLLFAGRGWKGVILPPRSCGFRFGTSGSGSGESNAAHNDLPGKVRHPEYDVCGRRPSRSIIEAES